MVTKNEQSPEDQIVEIYNNLVQSKHPHFLGGWPVLSGFDVKIGGFKWLDAIYFYSYWK